MHMKYIAVSKIIHVFVIVHNSIIFMKVSTRNLNFFNVLLIHKWFSVAITVKINVLSMFYERVTEKFPFSLPYTMWYCDTFLFYRELMFYNWIFALI